MMTNRHAKAAQGMTLIELMVAMLLGIIVIGGILTIFQSTSASNKAQAQMASLQESGRYAMNRLREDIGMANALYCSGSGGSAKDNGATLPALDSLRTPVVMTPNLAAALHDVTTDWATDGYPAAPTEPYPMPSFWYMRGYDCDASGNCLPEDPTTDVGADEIPAQGTDEDDRVVGSSVLTVRYLDSSMGWSIGRPGGSALTADVNGKLSTITLTPLQPSNYDSDDHFEPLATDFGKNEDGTTGNDHLAILGDCSLQRVFAVTGEGTGTLTVDTGSANFSGADPGMWANLTNVRLFDFNRAFKTVTWYLKVVEMANGDTTGALIRRVNGKDHELVRGVERLDFRYLVMDNSGNVRSLTANQVDTRAGGSIDCPPQAPELNASALINPAGCLWRAVQEVEVSLVVSGQRPLASLTDSELAYAYGPDNIDTPAAPTSHAVQPVAHQGFPKNVLRREFSALISIRNYNP